MQRFLRQDADPFRRSPSVSWRLSCHPSAVPRARHLARDQLADWGLGEHSEVTELLVSELVTNALCHAWGPTRLTLSFSPDGTLRCEVQDTAPDLPRLRHAREDDEGGRGLHLLDLLSHRWGSDLTLAGKIVWFELPTRPPPDADPGDAPP